MERVVYLMPKHGGLVNVGFLLPATKSYQVQLLNEDSGEFDGPLLRSSNVTNYVREFDSFRWALRCTGCGWFIRGNVEAARRRIGVGDCVPSGHECHYWASEAAKVKKPLVQIDRIPEIARKYFDGECWAGIPCSESQTEPYGCNIH